jgi:TRAP-type C4-dicarboxylate transport system permease small subunit
MKFFSIISKLILILAYTAGIAIIFMILITTADVILRIFNVGIPGTYDMVRACGAVAVSCALPYLTAVKGHIAIEYFYQKCRRFWRIILDTLLRLSSLVIFGTLGVKIFSHGLNLFKSGEVFPNLGMPVFWIPLLISFNCFLMMIVFFYHLIHPGKELIKP